MLKRSECNDGYIPGTAADAPFRAAIRVAFTALIGDAGLPTNQHRTEENR